MRNVIGRVKVGLGETIEIKQYKKYKRVDVGLELDVPEKGSVEKIFDKAWGEVEHQLDRRIEITEKQLVEKAEKTGDHIAKRRNKLKRRKRKDL